MWNREWTRATLVPAAPPQPPQQQEGEQKQGEDCEEALYTGRSRGTKRSWSNEGLERFNALMVDVYRDRQENGTSFDFVFKEEMIKRYSKKQNDDPDPGGQEHEQMPSVSRVVQVYSNFNIEQLVAHANAGTTAGGVASRQQQGNDDDHDADEEISTVVVV